MAGGGLNMAEKEISIRVEDLSKMEIYCLACGLGVIIDWEKQHAFPQHCCGCNREFSESARNAMAAYQRFFQNAREAQRSKEYGVEVKFRVKAP